MGYGSLRLRLLVLVPACEDKGSDVRFMRDAVREGKVRVNPSGGADGVGVLSVLHREEPSPVDQLLVGLGHLVVLLNLSLPDAPEFDMTWSIRTERPPSGERND